MERSSIITHTAWLAVAAGAFATGMAIKGQSETEGAQASPSTLQVSKAGGLTALGERKGSSSEPIAPGATVLVTTDRARTAAELVGEFLASNDAVEQNYLFAQMLLSLTPENAEEMYEALKGRLSGRDGGRQMSLLFQAWGKVDGAAAIAAAMESNQGGGGGPGRGRGGGPPGGFGVMSVLTGWASADPSAAKEWLTTVEDDRQKNFYTYGLINGMAKTDPDAATAYVFDLAAQRDAAAAESEEGGERGRGGFDITSRYINTIASEQIKQGIDNAVDWADNLPDGDIKASAFDQIAESYVRSDLDAAKDWVSEYADQEYASRAVSEVAGRLAAEDPQAAVEWAASLPESTQDNAYSRTMDQWTRSDPTAASEYLAGMEASAARDAAVSSFATALDRENPADAATWAATIADESTRTQTLTQVARSWMRSDAEGAKAWLPTSGLPAETQTQIIENPGFGGFGGGGPGGGRDFRRPGGGGR